MNFADLYNFCWTCWTGSEFLKIWTKQSLDPTRNMISYDVRNSLFPITAPDFEEHTGKGADRTRICTWKSIKCSVSLLQLQGFSLTTADNCIKSNSYTVAE